LPAPKKIIKRKGGSPILKKGKKAPIRTREKDAGCARGAGWGNPRGFPQLRGKMRAPAKIKNRGFRS